MEKVVLVIDSPAMCSECRFCECWFDEEYNEMNHSCMVEPRLVPSDGKSDFCPLKPLPEEKDEYGTWTVNGWEDDGYNRGWNDCLTEIAK